MSTITEALRELREDTKDDFIEKWGSEYNFKNSPGSNYFKLPLDYIHPVGLFKDVNLTSETTVGFKVLSKGVQFNYSSYDIFGKTNAIDPEYFIENILGKKAYENIIKMFEIEKVSDFIWRQCQDICWKHNVDLSSYWGESAVKVRMYFKFKYWTIEIELFIDKKSYKLTSGYYGNPQVWIKRNSYGAVTINKFGEIMEEFKDIFEGRTSLLSDLNNIKTFLESIDANEMLNGQEWIKLTEENIEQWA